jgi:hypothetical protein
MIAPRGRRRKRPPVRGMRPPRDRPHYGPRDELYIAALVRLADRMADAHRRGDLFALTVARCWAELVLRWWGDR